MSTDNPRARPLAMSVDEARVNALREAILAQPAPEPEDLMGALRLLIAGTVVRALRQGETSQMVHPLLEDAHARRMAKVADAVIEALSLSASRGYFHGGGSTVHLSGVLPDPPLPPAGVGPTKDSNE